MPEREPPEDNDDWKTMLQKAVNLAATDPEAFRMAAGGLAAKLGLTIEELYAQVKRDPDFLKRNARRVISNSLIQGLAKRVKKEFGI